jgi:hypothetical protein
MKATGRIFLGLGIISAAVAVASWRKSQQTRYESRVLNRISDYKNDPSASIYYDEESDTYTISRNILKGFLDKMTEKGEIWINRLQNKWTDH